MSPLLNLSIEPARRLFEVSVTMAGSAPLRRRLQVLADTPAGAARIVRQRYPQARSAQVRACVGATVD